MIIYPTCLQSGSPLCLKFIVIYILYGLFTVPAGCLVLGEVSLVWTENPASASVERCHIQAQNPSGKHPETNYNHL